MSPRRDPFRAAHALVERAVQARQLQSATLLVAVEGQPLLHRAYGAARLDTVFDLASLTKPLATTAVLMRLVAEGRLSLELPLAELVPQTAAHPVGKLRLTELLSHSSGLPAWHPYYEVVRGKTPAAAKQAVRRQLARQPLARRPGAAAVYSDLGFLLLEWAIERAAGARLDRLAQRLVYEPLGLSRTFFVDLRRDEPRADLVRRLPFAPTERCPWRKRRLLAEVHDDNCFTMGGICGHAGLFSSAHDVHLIARQLLSAYHGQPSIFAPPVVRRFFDHPRTKGSSWALGWDRPAETGASCGRLFNRHAVGHLGFTGTSLWIDLERPLWAVLLSNRVYYGREPNPMLRFRPRLHDALMRALPAAE